MPPEPTPGSPGNERRKALAESEIHDEVASVHARVAMAMASATTAELKPSSSPQCAMRSALARSPHASGDWRLFGGKLAMLGAAIGLPMAGVEIWAHSAGYELPDTVCGPENCHRTQKPTYYPPEADNSLPQIHIQRR